MTKKEMYTYIAENFDGEFVDEVKNFCEHEIEMLNSRSSRKTLSATQKANIPLREAIADTLSNAPDGMTIKEISEQCAAVAGMTPQKVTGLVRGIEGVTAEKVGKAMVYRIA